MILVVGGTGDLGGRIVRRLIEDGRQLRCVVRAGSDGSPLRARGAEVVTGDLTDPASLRMACEGVDIVVASATVIGRRLAGAKRPKIVDADELGMASVIEAAEASGVQRFVYVSYAGLDRSLGTPLERAKVATERRLRASPMQRLVVRPDAFQEVHLGPLGRFDVKAGKVAVFGRGDRKRRWVAADDVAALVAAVTSESDPPELIEFGGPDALSRNEALAAAERATGRSFKVQLQGAARAAARRAAGYEAPPPSQRRPGEHLWHRRHDGPVRNHLGRRPAARTRHHAPLSHRLDQPAGGPFLEGPIATHTCRIQLARTIAPSCRISAVPSGHIRRNGLPEARTRAVAL